MATNYTVYVLSNNSGFSEAGSYSFNVWFLSFLLVLTAPVNIVIIYLLSQQRKTINTCGFTTFAVSLAVTDALVGSIILPVHVVQFCLKHWPLGTVSCLCFQILDYGMTSVSIFVMAAMGYDRYRCVTSPMAYRVNFKRRCVIMTSVTIWILGIGAWVPGLVISYLRNGKDPVTAICTVMNLGYLSIPYAFVMYHTPLAFTVIIYVKLSLNLRKRFHLKSTQNVRYRAYPDTGQTVHSISSILHRHLEPLDCINVVNENSTSTVILKCPTESHGSPRGSIQYPTPGLDAQNQKCLKTSLLVVISFVFCWAPVDLLWPVVQVCADCMDIKIYRTIYMLCYANSTINPFIYLATSGKLRQDFKKLILRQEINAEIFCINK